MDSAAKIYVAGHTGMVGSAIIRCLTEQGYGNFVLSSSRDLDLTRQADVEKFLGEKRPEIIFMAAARVGGILANNTYRADFSYINTMIQCNIIHSAWKVGVKKLLFFSSSCVYPRDCSQPMREELLWTGRLETTNEPYAVAKLSGMSMCRAYNEQYGTNFISVLPTNLYGINDRFDPNQSHVMAALISKFHSAHISNNPNVLLWGTGTPRRELLDVDDAADAAVFLMKNYKGNEPVNIGVGVDLSIQELAGLVAEVVGYKGEILFDADKPDGVPQKLLDVSKLCSLGWKSRISLEEGIRKAYSWYLRSPASQTIQLI